jgi:hypothetical protein
LTDQDAVKFASKTFGVTNTAVLRWKDEFIRDGMFVQAVTGNRTVKRSWLLEEYPELLLTAQRWVNHNLDEAESRGDKPFKITVKCCG